MPIPDGWSFAGGRLLPKLLFVTCPTLLSQRIGEADAKDVCAAIRGAGLALLEISLDDCSTFELASAAVMSARSADTLGVVLVGGFDVLPSNRLDTLPQALVPNVDITQDDDQYFVWSDDAYGTRAFGETPSIPVSRIPDAGSADFVWKNLGANSIPPSVVRGLRNVNRPFADVIFQALSGADNPMLVSEPTTSDATPPYDLSAEHIYLMLHGIDSDGTKFYGEDARYDPVLAVELVNVPTVAGSIVFTGCCYGALIVQERACDSTSTTTSREIHESIALTFLDRGSRAFVGCTAVHYSPADPPYRTLAGPLHEAFWRRLIDGLAPAEALFAAKYLDFSAGLPYVDRDDFPGQAIELKIRDQFTCLGLGW